MTFEQLKSMKLQQLQKPNPKLAKPELDLSYELSAHQQARQNRKKFLDHAKAHRDLDPSLNFNYIRGKVTHANSAGELL